MRHMGRAEDFSAGSDMIQRLSPFNKLRVRGIAKPSAELVEA